jgi:phospholipid transport system substrate-binding protein
MNRFATQFVLIPLICAAFAAPCLADATTQPTAPQVIQQVSHDVIAVLSDKSLSPQEKRDKVRDIAWANINFEIMSRLCIGHAWRDLSDDQRTDYVQQFKLLVTNTYIHLVDNYTDQQLQMLGDRQESDGDWTVLTRLTGTKDDKPNQELAKLDYRLRNKGGDWKIIDMTIDNASLVLNYRAQFQDILSNGGVDHLLQVLHQKNAANDK